MVCACHNQMCTAYLSLTIHTISQSCLFSTS
nr:MAG TPA: hypothetical protein [Caudoviricetes sp.]